MRFALALLWFITFACLFATPWIIAASDAMNNCQARYSYETCVSVLR